MKKKKDVLFLCQYFYPEYISSATLPFDTAIALAESGMDVGVLCGYPVEYNRGGNVPTKEKVKNVVINRVKYLTINRANKLGRLINFSSFTLRCLLKLGMFRKAKSVIVYSNPPVLPLVAILANILWKTKIVFVCYDVYPEIAINTGVTSEKSVIAKLMNIINKGLFKRVSRVVALSNEMKLFLQNSRIIESDKISVIANWYEVTEKKKTTEGVDKKLLEIKKDNDLVVSYFGNMGICQDMDTILDAISRNRINNIKFLFAGHGIKKQVIKNFAKENKYDNVYVFDFLHESDFEYALGISDCFITSLISNASGLCVPSKTYSYMAEGKPIIAIMSEDTDIAKDILLNNAGMVCDNGDSAKIQAFLEKMYNDRAKLAEMSENCHNIFLKKYTKQICTNMYCEMFRDVLKSL